MYHIAGPWVAIKKDRVIQRCVACGYALIDQRCSETMVPDKPDGSNGDGGIGTFGHGDVIEVYGINPVQTRLMGTLNNEVVDEHCPLFEKIEDIPQFCTEA